MKYSDGASFAYIWGKNILDTRKRVFKGPEIGTCLTIRNRKEAGMAGAE